MTLRLAAISKATSYKVMYRPTTTSSAQETTTTSLTCTISGLDPNTEYAFNYCGVNQYGTGPFTTTAYATTLGLVEPWDWNISNGPNATAAQTQKAHQALINKGPSTDFYYGVWNDMVEKAAEIVDARGVNWNADYGSVDATRATTTDKNITARRVNAIWWNMGHFISTGLQEQQPGNLITGQYFIDLANAMNRAIP